MNFCISTDSSKHFNFRHHTCLCNFFPSRYKNAGQELRWEAGIACVWWSGLPIDWTRAAHLLSTKNKKTAFRILFRVWVIYDSSRLCLVIIPEAFVDSIVGDVSIFGRLWHSVSSWQFCHWMCSRRFPIDDEVTIEKKSHPYLMEGAGSASLSNLKSFDQND